MILDSIFSRAVPSAMLAHLQSKGLNPTSYNMPDPLDRSTWAVTSDSGDAAAALVDFSVLDIVKRLTREQVDRDAEACRERFLTAGAGMALTYQEKHAQAVTVAAMGEAAANALSSEDASSRFPTLAASVGIEGATLWACAQTVRMRYQAFALLSAQIELARLGGKAAIAAAPTIAAVKSAYAAITWPTSAPSVTSVPDVTAYATRSELAVLQEAVSGILASIARANAG